MLTKTKRIYYLILITFLLIVVVANPTQSARFKPRINIQPSTATAAPIEDSSNNDDQNQDSESAAAAAEAAAEKDENDNDGKSPANVISSSRPNTTAIFTSTSSATGKQPSDDCVPPSINDFPKDLFTQSQRRFGAIIFHVAFAVYLYVCITRLCDDYFMSSLEIIGQKLNLDQDVAGATFMAAGSSAPEVFISLVGVFVSESSTGIGAIVGSAVFNILFVIGICGLFIAGTSKLTVWPFIRDSVFYFIAILALILLIRDDKVYWYESLLLLLLYGGYLFFMMNNDRLKTKCMEKFKILEQEAKNILPESGGGGGGARGDGPVQNNKAFGFLSKRSSIPTQSGYNRFNEDDELYAWGGTMENISDQQQHQQNITYQNSTGGAFSRPNPNIDYNSLRNADSLVKSSTRQIDFDTAALHIMMDKRYFGPKTRFRMAVRRVIDEIHWIKRSSMNQGNNFPAINFDHNPLNKENYSMFLYDMPNINEKGLLAFLLWLIFVPARIIFHFTIPDCRVEKYKKFYQATFGLSILWLAVISYLIIWMITVIGYTLGIPDSLMAITFVAAGTSIPDAYTSIVVVKEGMVDMGVSNIIGSNVFDLLIGLAFPWFIKSIFNNGFVTINSNGLVYDTLVLFACVLVTIGIIHFRNWHLDRRTGYIFLSVYVAFLIFASAIELNLFSYVNPPMC